MEKNVESANIELEKIESQLQKNKNKQEEWNKKIDEMNHKMKNSDEIINSHEKMNNDIENINNSIGNTIKKVAKWSLAVFGVRSAYSAIRSAMSTLSQYNDKMATDIEYIKFSLAKVLEPVIKGLINLVYRLLSYVNYLAKAWFGVNLFANSSAKSFTNMKKSASSTAKSTKEINKNLAGFDELNILEDKSSKGSNIATPSFDLSEIEDIKKPKWLEIVKDIGQWIIDHWKEIVIAIGLVGAALIGIKIVSWIKNAKSAKKATENLGSTFKGFFDGLGKAVEAIAILGGLKLVIDSITNLIDTFSQSGMSLGEVAGLLGIVLGELAAAFIVLLGAMTLLEPSWQSIAAAVVIFGGLALVINSVTKLIDTFANSGLSLNEVIGLMSTILVTIVALMGSIVLLGPAMTVGLGPFLAVVASISAILIVMAATLPTILNAVGNFINAIAPSLIAIITTINSCINNTIYALGTVLPPIITSVGNLFTSIFNGVSNVIRTVGSVIVSIMNTAKSLITTVLKSILDFINKLGPAINNFVDNAIEAITKLINFLISGIEYTINTLIINAINSLLKSLNKIPGVDFDTLENVKIPRFKPVLMATGGIIDVPKRGVPLANNVVGGEAGAEGVLPLTNTDTMQELGKEIGKWVGFNINFNGSLSQLARILKPEIEREQNRVGSTLIGGNIS